ncbi:MAG: hypothetical protein IIC03_05710 [Proteobacteria bacterium]|nr:hypothetical protein [Pseudomonadota bacterium]
MRAPCPGPDPGPRAGACGLAGAAAADAVRALPPPPVERPIDPILSLDRIKTLAPMTAILRQPER